MSRLKVHIEGIGLFGPGLSGWAHASEVLAGKSALELGPVRLPSPDALPPAERRRVGTAIKLSMAVGFDAVQDAGVDARHLATVFSSTGGDCDNCNTLLETLASDDRSVSPTRFHNSVHNAPAGYWSIATSCMAPSSSLCAYDATFSAGLLEAATQVVTSGQHCLLTAFDTAYPEPLNSLRPIPYPFGIGLVLSPNKTSATKAAITLKLSQDSATIVLDQGLENLRKAIPAARSLPLLQLLALRRQSTVIIDYIDSLNLCVEVSG